MTIMTMHNRNGYSNETRNQVYRFSDMLKDVLGNEQQVNNCYSTPRVNIREENDTFFLSLAAPGLKKSDIILNLEKDILHIYHKAEDEDTVSNFNRKEFDFKNFERSFKMPEFIDTGKIKASYADGILTVTLPKLEEAIDRGPRVIKIS